MTLRSARRASNAEPLPVASNDAPLPFDASPGDDIPPHVWALLQEAGAKAAERLRDILGSQAFNSYAPTAKARLIELAMTRAYGLPVKRSVNLSLSSDDADAVASSLAGLTDALPERAPQGRMRDVTPSEMSGDSQDV